MRIFRVVLVLAVAVAPSAASAQRAQAQVTPAFEPENFAAAVDPRADGWDTEALSEQAEAQLKSVAAWLADVAADGPDALASGDVASVVDQAFESSGFVPGELTARYRGTAFAVDSGSVSGAATTYRGAQGFRRALGALAERLAGDRSPRADFKLYSVDAGSAGFTILAHFEASVAGPAGSRQLNAVWSTIWRLPADGDGGPLMLRVEVADYEETSTPRGPLFVDVTEAAVGHNPSYQDQLLQSPDAWLNRIPKAVGYNKTGWQGVSVADVNGDGLDDIFLPEQGGLPNRLYVQNREGTFDDRSAEAAIDYLERALAGLFVDLDNDGDQDLVLSSRPAVLVLENDGGGQFARVRHIAGNIPDSNSLSAADYDGDGDLDLYICGYRRAYDERGVASPVPYHDANNGGRNVLLRNDGGFRFVDATVEAGLDVNNRRFSLAASWEDFDGDGDADLYVANDYGRNNLYRNDGGRFVDVAGEAGVEDISSGMSVSWADYNRDGRMDVYVGNMFSAAGNRITYQRKFERDRQRAGPLAEVQRMARGNSLFAGTSGGAFRDRSVDANVTMGRWSWSSVFADINNDGWEDLVVANGNLTQTLPDDL
ncbi:MAG: VCBS repeat-containing protein [Holophagales bacterium]|nr:VCBS repeat-containing protein [Holophagales bacterium]MXX61483.1 VCBS repeat-containing protein [Holophagales bacterium]MYC09811.1 VCBS repeat-containing protein [Holophagales bacterium]MYD23289.1 VCBS repeat-containing protein [Holophagales bacterium]MYI32899.1 VCBS repeat-containing protein [Holophagales bacterium]